ncbi:LuxR C-terminal-related transcriptional regulator [Streptomyces sp. CA-111067]|uniref:helix-turn-helix transcriptional regulator n=1 Tax=Streptomyces sp. CA-111067 TaxID=3240046 RepID=UPI003D966A96
MIAVPPPPRPPSPSPSPSQPSSSPPPHPLPRPSAHEDAALSLYLALRSHGPCGEEDWWQIVVPSVGLDEERVALGWALLRDLELVRVDHGMCTALEPETALAEINDAYQAGAAEQMRNAVALQVATRSLTEVFRPAVARESAEIATEYITNKQRIQQTSADLSRAARVSTDSLHPGPMPPMPYLERSLELDRRSIEKGVKVRCVYPVSLMLTPKYARYLHDLTGIGAEVRLVDHAPYDLLIIDGVVACLPSNPARPAEAMVAVRGSALLRSYRSLYEDFWLRAVPLADAEPPTAAGTAPDAQELVVIQLMASGLSDDQIARKLAIHRRTVQRCVAKLMDRLGVSSRFEAGLRLARDPDYARALSIDPGDPAEPGAPAHPAGPSDPANPAGPIKAAPPAATEPD